MTVLRRVARPLLASTFVVEGVDAVMRPDAHTGALKDLEPQLAKVADDVPYVPRDVRTVVRVSGAVSAGAGVLLTLGIAPRVAAGVLAAVQVPAILLRNPFWSAKGDQRKEYLQGALRGASLLGGLLLATADTAGKPSLAWRWEHSREESAKHKAELEKAREQVERRLGRSHRFRLHARDARHAVHDVTQEAKHTVSDARREARHTAHGAAAGAKHTVADVATSAKSSAREAKRAAKDRTADVRRALQDALPG